LLHRSERPARAHLHDREGQQYCDVQVDLRNGEQFSDAFRKINSDGTVPVLEPDGGTVIADAISTAHCCCSSPAGRFMAGTTIVVDGGQMLALSGRELTAPS
jgi:hypothetical protein